MRAQARESFMERRRRRSAETATALRYYLEGLVARQSWTAAALADDDGLLLGGATTQVDLEAMAAVAPLLAREPEPPRPDGFLGLVTRGHPLRVWGVCLDGDRFHLVTAGAERAPPADAEAALERILTASHGVC
jgi:hypothetical protein